MEMSTSELARLTELHFQGAIHHLQKEPPAQIMGMHCRGAHFFPLIIQTETLAVMDMPTLEVPKIQRDDCLPRICCFTNKKTCHSTRGSYATPNFAEEKFSFAPLYAVHMGYPGNGTLREQSALPAAFDTSRIAAISTASPSNKPPAGRMHL